MKRLLIVWILLLVITSSCGGPVVTPEPTPTAAVTEMGAANAALELIRQDMYIRLTQQSAESLRVEMGARMTATQQALDGTATAVRHDENVAQAQAAAAATKVVWNVTVAAAKVQDEATARAQAAATEQAYVQATSTAYAQGTATQAAVIGLTATIQAAATAASAERTQQAPFVAAQMTAVQAQAESAELAATRARMTNGVLAWGPWVIVLAALGITAFSIYRKSQVGTVERDSNGMMPGVVIFHRGQKQFISPDRMFGPVLTLDQSGISAPVLADPDRQEGTTRRAQAVEAIGALPPQQQRQGIGLMSETFSQAAQRPNIEVVENGQVRNWIDEAESALGEM
jgi:hypothetical protein